MKDCYVHGAHNVICDASGFKIKSTESRKMWDDKIVHHKYFESRHPMDFLRGFPDNPAVPDARPDSTPTFVGVVDPALF